MEDQCLEEIREKEIMKDLLSRKFVIGQVSMLDSVWYLSDILNPVNDGFEEVNIYGL